MFILISYIDSSKLKLASSSLFEGRISEAPSLQSSLMLLFIFDHSYVSMDASKAHWPGQYSSSKAKTWVAGVTKSCWGQYLQLGTASAVRPVASSRNISLALSGPEG
jgi:hypothetical protein